MKTLRETIDQLDEISRRGFLQGAGAAAVAGAAGGAKAQYNPNLNPNIPQDLDFMLQTIEGACALYYYVKIENPDVPWAKELTNALSKFSRKDLLKEKYPPIYRYFQEKKISDPKGYSNQLNSVIRNQKQIIQDLNSLSEFNESVNQGVAEESSPDALAKIDELSK